MSESRKTSPSAPPNERVCIIIVNWNGWRDTIECLESLFRSDYASYTIVVCDNGSSDHSLEQIERWANGEILASCSNSRLASLTSPAIAKPIQFASYASPQDSLNPLPAGPRLVLIQNGCNRGFAAGCNIGLSYSLEHGYGLAWLLNNDTVVCTDTLSKLVETLKNEPRMGICGSVLLDYNSEQNVQAIGGRRYSAWSGRVLNQPQFTLADIHRSSRSIDYVHGASMLVRRNFLKTVGLLDENYFLYFEELDWATRAGNRFLIGYSPLSIVYHKEGASIGTNARVISRSSISEWYAARNRILFTRRFHPAFVPSVLFWVFLTALHRLVTGNPSKAKHIALAAWEGLTCNKVSSTSTGSK